MKKIPLWPALLAAAELSAAGGVKPAAFLWCEAPPELARLFGSAGLKPEKAGPGNTDAPVQFLSGRFDHAANAKRYVDAVRAGKTARMDRAENVRRDPLHGGEIVFHVCITP